MSSPVLSGRSCRRTAVLLLSLTVAALAADTRTADATEWPLYRRDAARSGYTPEPLPSKLALRWTHVPVAPPHAAWPRSRRMLFDRAPQPVIGEGRVFYGSSVDGMVRASDLNTGRIEWAYPTDGPIRFAPAYWNGRVFVTSDDGYLYCLDSATGALLWKRRGGASDSMLLGNERMVSRWPARGGVTLLDGVVYFAAGIWPSEGIYIHALDAVSGETLWDNPDAGSIYMAQPHGGANAVSGVSAQGHLVATADHLFVPTGRAVPAAFDRRFGKLLYFHLQRHGGSGGSSTVAQGDYFYNDGLAFNATHGALAAKPGAGSLAATPSGLWRGAKGRLSLLRWTDVEAVDRKGKKTTKTELRTIREVDAGDSRYGLIVCDRQAICGGDGRVTVVDVESQARQSLEVEGKAYALAAAGGVLLVGTDVGRIYAFGAARPEPAPTSLSATPPTLGSLVVASSGADSSETFVVSERVQANARAIVEETGIRRGYCLDYGCGDGALTEALVRQSDLVVYAVDSDPEAVARARQRLLATGLYGTRAFVLHRSLEQTGLPDAFANLIVSGRSQSAAGAGSTSGTDDLWVAANPEVARLQRPYGGVACFGPREELRITVRGALEGAGQWTHQYADPGNTTCSNDEIRGPLALSWFRDVQQALVQRHGRGPAPLFLNGRLFSEGLDSIVAVDAYNGRLLWEHRLEGILRAYDGDHLMGTSGTQSNYCVTPAGVFVRREDYCLRLDVATGALSHKFQLPESAPIEGDDSGEATKKKPGKKPVWGYVASTGGILFGSAANPDHVVTYRYLDSGDLSQQLTESRRFFAYDAKSGKLLWQYTARDSIRHNAIAVGGGRVHLIDRPLAEYDRRRKAPPTATRPGRLIALDAESGEPIWEVSEDVYGTVLSLSVEHDALLMSYQPTRFRLASERGGRLGAFRASDGQLLWQKEAKYSSRPLINDRTVYSEGGAWDLLYGAERPFRFERSYGCGVLAGGSHLMVFRSATLGYYDLRDGRETKNYGGLRPGCWINAIPAGGRVLVPDGSAGCRCSYLNRAWIALQGTPPISQTDAAAE